VPTVGPSPTAVEDPAAPALVGVGPGALRRVLGDPSSFASVVELVPWAGELGDPRGQRPLRMAQDLAGDPRITALSVTDNAGGHARLGPEAAAAALRQLGHDVIVHVAARDRNRNALQSLGWDLLSRGLNTILAISGDYPVDGFEGLARPVFDVDSVALLAMYRDLAEGAIARALAEGSLDAGPHDLFLGCAVDPFKRLERDLVPQLLKLALKARAGADFVMTQVGYDPRRQDELLRWMRGAGVDLPVVANAYILSPGVARAFHAGRVPGCVVTDELLALVERHAASVDKGRAFCLELAAKQLVVARGLGFRGIYLCGNRDADEIRTVLELAATHDPGDWRALVRDVSFRERGAFHLFEGDGAGLATDEPSRAYASTLAASSRRRARAGVDPFYRFNRLVHRRVFEPGTAGFRTWAGVYGAVERAHLGRPLHVLEQAVKVPLYDCRDCGDCSLPDVAYLCPESRCAKNQRNGPCGGSRDGRCEVGDRPCAWAEAYRRLKPYGEELTMLERAPVINDNRLRRTSAWANTFLERDHFAARTRVATASTTEKGSAS
jgi:methylenetetrahydrofolate reductase (NADPH)